ncbi:hypothetical protein OF83DRAFT_1294893 [Amylostereum chailletii]|nr:hypothetical protein OF83DRAFT_1294893 [Amylostereum chailletii]
MDANDYGTFGVLRFLKKTDDNAVVASYPIDDDELTFGKEAGCNVRLYYPAVSSLHAKIVFQDRKAFIVVLGPHGVLVDNCPVFPSASHGAPTTVPLPNNSLVEINKKRFRFEYPPKTLRTALINTPSSSTSGRKRTLRLSMIQSAQVFTPRPDPDPRVNLRILQTPLHTSPLKHGHRTQMQDEVDQRESDDEDEDEAPIVLVDGNHPRVVEEDKDLVILEDVELPDTQPPPAPKYPPGVASPRPRQPSGSHAAPLPVPLVQPHQQQYQTPRRRPPRSSLHRAVLIRSAQRAAIREIERQEEEERDVEAVEDAVREGWRRFRSRSRSPSKDEHEEHEAEDDEEDNEEEEEEEEEPFHYDTPSKPDDTAQTVPVDAHAGEPDDADDLAYNPHYFTPQRPQRPAGGGGGIAPFMTPQPLRLGNSLADRVRGLGRLSVGAGRGRTSVGGQAWRVGDLDVREHAPSAVKKEDEGEPRLVVRPRVTAEERRAIQERRRSAMNMPDPLFGDCIPGSRRTSVTPATKPESPTKDPGPSSFEAQMSPAKAWAAARRAQATVEAVEEEEEEDTCVLLARMKGVVEGMKRRRSMHAEGNVQRPLVFPESKENTYEARPDPIQGEHDGEPRANAPMDTEAESESILAPAPATPPMAELKHLFSQNQQQQGASSTPRMDGMREMFQQPSAAATPGFEGVDTMLATPPAYRARSYARSRAEEEEEEEMQIVPSSDDEEAKQAAEAELRDSDDSDDEVKKEEKEKDPPARSVGRPKKTPAPASTKAKPSLAPAPVAPKTAKSRIAVSLRTRTPAAGASSMADDELTPAAPPTRGSKKAQLAEAPKGAIVRRTRRVEADTEEDTPAIAPATKPAAKTKKAESSTRSATKGKGKAVAEPQDDPAPAPAPARRTRKAVTEDAPAPKPALRKTTRAGAASTKASSRTRSKTAESSKAVKDEEDDDDPLDSLTQPDEEPPAPAHVPTKAKRGRPRAATAASATQDEDEESVPLRGSTRSATGRKTPARAAAAAAKGGLVGKENTPELGHTSAQDDDEEEEPVVTVKPKTAAATRTGTRRKAAQAQAQSEPEREPAVVKTRATRSRTATGRG